MLTQFNSIVLDVILVVALLGLLAIGIFKGVKHTAINIFLLALSIVAGFISYTDIIKVPIAEMLASMINVGNKVALTAESKMGVAMMYMFFASLILTILIYVLLRLIKVIIVRIVRKREGRGKPKLKPASMVFGGIVSLLIHGVFVIVLMSLADNPLVGMDKTIENSYVTKYVVRADDMLLEAIGQDDEKIASHILVIALKGDFLVKVSDETITNIQEVSKILTQGVIAPESLDGNNAEIFVKKLDYVLSLQEALFIDEEGKTIPGNEEFIKQSNDVIAKALSKAISLNEGKEKIDGIENASKVAVKLNKICGPTAASKFAEIFIV